jgi:hypothetical protein
MISLKKNPRISLIGNEKIEFAQKQYLEEYMPIYWACIQNLGYHYQINSPKLIGERFIVENITGVMTDSAFPYTEPYSRMPVIGIPGESTIDISFASKTRGTFSSSLSDKMKPLVASWYMIRAFYMAQIQTYWIGHCLLMRTPELGIRYNGADSGLFSMLDIPQFRFEFFKNPEKIPSQTKISIENSQTNQSISTHINAPESNSFAFSVLRSAVGITYMTGDFSAIYGIARPEQMELYPDQRIGSSLLFDWSVQSAIAPRFHYKGIRAITNVAADNAVVFAKNFAKSNKNWVSIVIENLDRIYNSMPNHNNNQDLHMCMHLGSVLDIKYVSGTIYSPDHDSVYNPSYENLTKEGIMYPSSERESPIARYYIENNAKQSMHDITSCIVNIALLDPDYAASNLNNEFIRDVTQTEFKEEFLGTNLAPINSKRWKNRWRPKLTKGYDSTFYAIPGAIFAQGDSSKFPIVCGMLHLDKAVEYRWYLIHTFLRNISSYCSDFLQCVHNKHNANQEFIYLKEYVTTGNGERIKANIGEIKPDAIWAPQTPFARAYEWPSVSTMIRGYMRRAGKVPSINSPAYALKTITKIQEINGKISESQRTENAGNQEFPFVRKERDGQNEVLLDPPVPVRIPSPSNGTNP